MMELASLVRDILRQQHVEQLAQHREKDHEAEAEWEIARWRHRSGVVIHYPSHYLMGTHEEPDSFINALLIMKKKEMFFALLFYCFSALQLSVYCNVYCRMRFYGWREQVKRQGAKSLTW
ncbi:hypothetical protein [Klebsiella quasipneumoniae]|uniref:hypothetical protein n=1 Tax=Klebsiella quasipneumoniae TaxID=1463165 RepID=UPI00352ABC28